MRTDTIVTEVFRDADGTVQTKPIGTHKVRVLARRMLSIFIHLHRLAAAGGLTKADVHVDKSNLEDPDETNDAHWILDTSPVDMTGGTGALNKSVSIAQEDTPKWVRIRMIVEGGTIQIEALVSGKMEA